MSNQFDYRCPHCGNTDQIDVCAYVWVRLTADGTDADCSDNGSSEWSGESEAQCGACGHHGTVAGFSQDGASQPPCPASPVKTLA